MSGHRRRVSIRGLKWDPSPVWSLDSKLTERGEDYKEDFKKVKVF